MLWVAYFEQVWPLLKTRELGIKQGRFDGRWLIFIKLNAKAYRLIRTSEQSSQRLLKYAIYLSKISWQNQFEA